MLMTPSITSSFHPGFTGFGQEGIRHDLNRLYYSDYSRQGMMDPQVYGAPYYTGYNAVAPWAYAPYAQGYQGYDPRLAYARPYDYFRSYDYTRPYDYARSFEFNRPYDYFRSYDVARPFEYARPYDYTRSWDYTRGWDFPRSWDVARPYDYTRSYEVQRPYDYARSFEFNRPYDVARTYDYARPYEFGRPYDVTRSFETMRPQELPYARTSENMIRPIEGTPAFGSDAYCVPAMNSAETPDAYLIVVELPGVDLKDVNLQIHGSSLVLNAFRRPTWSNGTVTVNYHFAEGRFGTLRRVLPLPAGVLPGQIQANFLNGLLTIVLPKSGNGASLPQASIVINSNVPTTM